MRKSKLEKYQDVTEFANVIECEVKTTYPYSIDERWDPAFFKTQQSVIVELGCGRGEYTISLAEQNPAANYIGVDIKGTRIWHGANHALENNLENVMFLRMRIEHIADFFPENSVDQLWITFPDPIHKKQWKTSYRRLTSVEFFNRYKKFLKQDGIINFKTDDDILYDFTLDCIKEIGAKILLHTSDLYNSDIDNEAKLCQTRFEKKFSAIGRTIKYIQFQF